MVAVQPDHDRHESAATSRAGWVVVAIIAILALAGIRAITANRFGSMVVVSSARLISPAPRVSRELPATGADSDPAPASVGTQVTVAEGWEMKVIATGGIGDPTAAAEPLVTSTGGRPVVLVKASITNNSSVPAALASSVRLSLALPSGVAVEPAVCPPSLPGSLDMSASFPPGATAAGSLCFEVAPADAAGSVLRVESQPAEGAEVDRRFFALR